MTPNLNTGPRMTSVNDEPAEPLEQNGPTMFCLRPFVEAWVRSAGSELKSFAIPASESSLRALYAVASPGPYRSRYLQFGPMGLPAGPGSDRDLKRSTLSRILCTLQGPRTSGFTWHVRFDHHNLAAGLTARGLSYNRISTHTLPLHSDYDKVFTGFSSSTRNHIRKGRRRGAQIRLSTRLEDIQSYYQIYTQLAEEREGWSFIYPMEVLVELINLRQHARLLVAEVGDRIVAGGLFFFDSGSVRYWHGATDRNFSSYYPFYAILDEAIRWGCEIGARSFDFGASRGIASLERFKASWGAVLESNWEFTWHNPIWRTLFGIRGRLSKRFSQKSTPQH